MKLALCIEHPDQAEEIARCLEQIGREFCVSFEIDRFDSCTALLEQHSAGRTPLILLDGDMPDGLKAGARLRELDRDCRFILLTGDNGSALLGYSIHPDGFVRKPVAYHALRSAMLRCRQAWWGELRTLEVVVSRVRIPVALADISYLEISGRTLIIHGRYGCIETEMSMTQAESRLQGAPFVKCHRSYLVNLFRVRALERDSLVMVDKGTVPVSVDRRESVRQALRCLQEENPAFSLETGEDGGVW
ncbi:MAG: response regulator transcription factor [Clostridia bacterium]|nr:response regulator transcription factor [Clostridia bacterium]MBQ3077051.1 response regulator transcription factor [Clostridia bacterium]